MISNTRYTNIVYIGHGSFGNVYSAIDSITKSNVALKVVQLEFYRKDKFKRLLREINILQFLNSRYSLCLLNVFKTVENDQLFNVCLVMPLMNFDLKNVIDEFILQYNQIIRIIYQLLMGLKYLYEAGIIHRDLKPSNIGINKDMSIRLLDFGLAREINGDMTEYVVTRWYRPIEVFCNPHYTTPVDMWSAGCIFAELFTRQVLFRGSGQVDQVTKIIQITGFPNDELLSMSLNDDTVSGLRLYEHMAAKTNLLESHIRGDIERFILDEDGGDQQCCDNAVQLICQMLDLDPNKRPTPEIALNSALFAVHRAHLVEYNPDPVPQKYAFPFNLNRESDEAFQQLIIDQIDNFIPQA